MSLYPEPSRNVEPTPRLAPFSKLQKESPERTLLSWWYSISAPRDVSDNAPLEKREIVRRGRVASLILPVIIVVVFFPVLANWDNPLLLSILSLVILLDLVALFGLNRTGHVTAAGIVVVLGIELGVGTAIFTLPEGFGLINLPLFDIMVQSLVVAAAMLTPLSIFLIALINCLFVLIALHSNFLTPELTHMVEINTGSLLSTPITLHIVIAWLTFVLLRSTNRAIRRADRAEELAVLAEQNLALQQRELERTHQIEQGIEQILAVMTRFTNGDVMVRVPESQENVLWKIGRSLNNLLARQKDYQQKTMELEQARREIDALRAHSPHIPSSQSDLQRTREAAVRLKEAIRVAKSKHAPIVLPSRSGTIVDEIAMELYTIQP